MGFDDEQLSSAKIIESCLGANGGGDNDTVWLGGNMGGVTKSRPLGQNVLERVLTADDEDEVGIPLAVTISNESPKDPRLPTDS